MEIVRPGPQALVQDLGRPGLAGLGVGRSGAADRRSLMLANRLVGNPETHAGVEITFGGLVVRFDEDALVAVTGAPCPLTAGVRAAGMYGPFRVRAGEELRFGRPGAGLRSYLAVRGGVDVPEVLGSRATDLLAGLGPDPLAEGTVLPIGRTALDYPCVDIAPQAPYPDQPVLRVLPGPRADWFVPDALESLCGGPYEVSPESNRIGVRLTGPRLHRPERELPPEAMVLGALQVPPSGQPILFLADHPVTGGYPVIGVVEPEDLHLAAQVRPGQRIRFRVTAR
ncbi:5-oxoprolinase subunit C family protein [Allokutzneria oryzae]|uniref:Biotin-dependent carboxyltransferase family protein n=1 Tax=Allokutzneria oryzae TaxID=1378989 RepID=A0ABV6A887_9PSEU